MRKDTIWDRPSWPLKGKPSKIMDQINELLNNDYNFFEKDSYNYGFYKNKLIDETLTREQHNALKLLDLKIPINLDQIKKKYKKLVKIFRLIIQ